MVLYKPFQAMYTLSQDYTVEEKQIIRDFAKMVENKEIRYAERGNLTQSQMFQAI